jgi:ribosomal protein L20A (L18A)
LAQKPDGRELTTAVERARHTCQRARVTVMQVREARERRAAEAVTRRALVEKVYAEIKSRRLRMPSLP